MEAAMAGVLWRGYDPDAPLPCPVTALLSAVVPDPDAQEALLRRIAPRLEVRRPAAGHFVMLTDPEVVTGALRDLLATTGGAA